MSSKITRIFFVMLFISLAAPSPGKYNGGTGEPNNPYLISTPNDLNSIGLDVGWDMVNVWDIGENQTYPFLRTHLPSDINKDDKTNFYDLAILAVHWLNEK